MSEKPMSAAAPSLAEIGVWLEENEIAVSVNRHGGVWNVWVEYPGGSAFRGSAPTVEWAFGAAMRRWEELVRTVDLSRV